MKVAVVGAKGMLGQDMVRVLAEDGHQVLPSGREASEDPTFRHCDVTDLASVRRAIEGSEVVINCSAYTNVDGAESEVDAAYRVNALGSWNLALACQGGIPLVQISTDYVFDGAKSAPYDEFDVPNPQSVYGRSKRAGENYVEQLLSRYYIVRTSWLYGHGGKNFVETILKAGQERPELRVVDDQYGSPTNTDDLARAIARLIAIDRFGTYHMTNQGSCTWYDFAKEILRLAGIPTPVYPQTTAELNRPAPRPANSVMRNLALELSGQALLPPWEESLARYLAERTKAVKGA